MGRTICKRIICLGAWIADAISAGLLIESVIKRPDSVCASRGLPEERVRIRCKRIISPRCISTSLKLKMEGRLRILRSDMRTMNKSLGTFLGKDMLCSRSYK